MTAADVMERALQLLNYTDSYGDVSAKQNTELLKRAVPITNQILADVLFVMGQPTEQIIKADDKLPLSDDVTVRVLVPGICALIAQSESDSDNLAVFSDIYNQARATLPRAAESRQDVLPRPCL